MIRINDIIDKILENQCDANVEIVERAYIYSARVHEGQVRLSGEPYLSHPLEVAHILTTMNLDMVSIAAGLLHDVIEDTPVTEAEIGEMFGEEIRRIVAGVTKLAVLGHDSTQVAINPEYRQAESIRKMFLAMSGDIRVILIKLADRIHNMRTLRFHKVEKRRKIAQETLDIYAPIAGRLGIYWIKRELEDLSFMNMLPDDYAQIQYLVEKDKREREEYIQIVIETLRKIMGNAKIECEVEGRHKHAFSIFQKMQNQNLKFDEIYDIRAFRIIVKEKYQCYEALGHIHNTWKPIDYKFKDYVGRPKPNMYQSLHTTVVGHNGERMEIQIRTRDMDRIARYGIAAHWSYKEGKLVDGNMCEKFAWIQNLIENQESIQDPQEFMENVRIDLFPDEIYVFTPLGEVKALTKGATSVDFAYMVHTEVGDGCIGARVNGRMVPLRQELQTGDTVEIITAKDHQPSTDWLIFVKTVKAKSKIKQWIRVQEKNRSIALGKEMCEKAFRKYRLNFAALMKAEDMQKAVESFGFKTLDDLLANIGFGKITPLQFLRKFIPRPEEEEIKESFLNRIISKVRKKKDTSGIIVKGLDDILVKFGKCCQPVPGDAIIGYITQGSGVAVHRTNCLNVKSMNPERMIDVEWSREEAVAYPVKIYIQSHDRIGLLADLTANITKSGANIISATSETKENKMVDSNFTLTVKDTEQLKKIVSEIKKLKPVVHVQRLDN